MMPFGEYLPDMPALNNPGANVAKNCIARAGYYEPFPSTTVFSSALDARCRGAISAKGSDGSSYNYAGDATKLYSLASATFSDVSGATYTTGEFDRWEFVRWGNKMLATNFADNPQSITLGGGSFGDLTTLLKAKHIAVVGSFVVLGNTFDATDGNRPSRVRWSAINDETDFAISSATMSDQQDLQGDGGNVQRILGGDVGVVFQERSIQIMRFAGSPLVFQFDEVLPGIGTPAPGSIAQLGNVAFFLGQDGFRMLLNGTQSEQIGSGKVDRTFFNEVDDNHFDRMSAVIDPVKQVCVWSYPGPGSVGGRPNMALVYNYKDSRWSSLELESEFLLQSATQGFTLEEVGALYTTVEDIPGSLDDRTWSGGNFQFGCFTSDNKLCYFTGDSLTAQLETTEATPNKMGRGLITEVWPQIDGGGVSVQIGARNRQADQVLYGDISSLNSVGYCPVMQEGRYIRVRANLSGDWTKALGVDVKAEAMGKY